MLNIDTVFNDIHVHASFSKGLTFLRGFSGTGKTLLMKAIEVHCLTNKIKCHYFDFRASDLMEDSICTLVNALDVVLFDNADLYLTQSILKEINCNDKYLIICMKDTTSLSTANSNNYLVRYQELNLTIEICNYDKKL